MISLISFFVLLLAVISTNGNVSVHNPFYCFSEDPLRPQTAMFSIHTAYETVRGETINPNVSTCIPSKLWMLGRHGTRLPNAVEVNNMLQHSERLHIDILANYEQGKTSLCASDIELLRNWSFDADVTVPNAQRLTSEGWNEMEGLAERFQAAFPSILTSTYSPNDFFFRTTGTHRTQTSLNAFADGLFGFNGHLDVQFEEIPAQDHVLNANEFCPLYNEIISVNTEQVAFREGPEYQEMSTQVSAKLGFHSSHALRHIEVNTLNKICKYEQIWNRNVTSPFCAGFSIANYQALEFFEDLEFYYRVGYGHRDHRRLFENIACFLMQDLVRFLQSNDENDHRVKIYNQNLTMMLLVLANLGAFEDDSSITRHNFAQQMQRLWRTSTIAPMASNLAVIRYE